MRNSVIISLIWILLAFVPATADDQLPDGVQMVPAMTNNFARLIVVPEERQSESFMSVIRCQTYIQVDGGLKNTLCVRDSIEDMDLRRSVLDAVEDATFSPARVNGEVVRVYMNFMVVFSCQDGECGVLELRAVTYDGEVVWGNDVVWIKAKAR